MASDGSTSSTLVTGASGQDGSYLLEQLAGRGEVHGLCHSAEAAAALAVAFPGVITHVGDLADSEGIRRLIFEIEPTRIFNFAGNTSVERSWKFPTETADVLGIGPVRILDAAWQVQERTGRAVRFLQASSAEIFGDTAVVPQSETTPRKPVTPYGAAKSFAHEMVGVYRARGMFASSAILYNHESPRRPERFVTRKITSTVAAIARGDADHLTLGNVDARRDWGWAPDYVDAMVRAARAETPGDYVIATGRAHSVRDFVAAAFAAAGIADWEPLLRQDAAFMRPADPSELVGDATLARDVLGWTPTVAFEEIVARMVATDLS